jgi:hypothetical protein
MTHVGLRPVLLPGGTLTEAKHRELLEWLARSAPGMAPLDVSQLLATLAHESLDRGQREEAFTDLVDALSRADALRTGAADWGSEQPELTCDEAQDEARYALEDRANEALFALMNGTGER